MSIPYVTFDNDEFKDSPRVYKDDLILCPYCGDTHPVILGKSQKWNDETQSVEVEETESNAIQAFKCTSTNKIYICGVDNKALDWVTVKK